MLRVVKRLLLINTVISDRVVPWFVTVRSVPLENDLIPMVLPVMCISLRRLRLFCNVI